jgi:hypothetical protein
MNDTSDTHTDTLGAAMADPQALPQHGGRLVRLGDLVCHVMASEGKPLAPAVAAVADVLAGAVGRFNLVFKTGGAGYARPLADDYFVPGNTGTARLAVSRPAASRPGLGGGNWMAGAGVDLDRVAAQFGGRVAPMRGVKRIDPTGPAAPIYYTAAEGLAGAMRKQWEGNGLKREHLFSGRSPLAHMAIPLDAATALFGYGKPAAPGADVVALRPADLVSPADKAMGGQVAGGPPPSADWQSDDLQTLVNEYATACKAGARGARQRLIARWGELFPHRPVIASATGVQRAIDLAKARGIKAHTASPFAGLVPTKPAAGKKATRAKQAGKSAARKAA